MPLRALHVGFGICDLIPTLFLLRELQVGIPVTDEEGQRLGHSVTAAKQGIFQVVVSRICMAIPAMGEAVALGGTWEVLREGMMFSRCLEDSGGCKALGRVQGAVKGDPLPYSIFTLLNPSLPALLSPQPSPP